MEKAIVQSVEGVTLVGGGDPSRENIEESLKIAPVLVAADGGADRAMAFGISPQKVIGDLDSLSEAARNAVNPSNVHHLSEQDTTDFEKCLRSIEAPFVLAVGFAEARIDHTLAAMSVLARDVGRKTVLLTEEDVVFAAPKFLSLALEPGTRISLFPMARISGRSSGLRWPIDDLNFDPIRQIGTSNEAQGHVEISFDNEGMLVILPRRFLGMAIDVVTRLSPAP